MRVAVAILGLLALGGCAAEAPLKEEPAFYVSMANSRTPSWRQQCRGLDDLRLPPEQRPVGVAVDPAAVPGPSATEAMARRNKLDHDVIGRLASGSNRPDSPRVAVENISAGYHTLAEAFSGWRDSPSHRANMLKSGVTRIGIAAVYAPGSKYKVFWALILAASKHENRGVMPCSVRN